MFGKINRRQEIKNKEQEAAVYKSALEQTEQMLGKMCRMWIDAQQRISEMERGQRGLERQLEKVASAADSVSNASKQQLEKNQKLLQQAEEIAETQIKLRKEQKQIQKESGKAEAKKPISLTKVIAPITAELSNGMEEMRKMLDDVVELGKQMEVLSLNAAVEAGRMGEGGRKFVEAAEEVRGLSDKYQQTTSTLAQQLQMVGLKWQRSKGEIEEAEGRLKQQYERLGEARNACTAVGEEILNLPIAEFQDEMEKAFGDKALQERCQDVSQNIEEAKQNFKQQQESWNGLRQTAAEAKAFIREIQG